MIKPTEVRAIYDDHCSYWRDKRPEMRRLSNLYSMRYWKQEDDLNDNVSITVESSRGFEVIEGYVASLFTRDPAVTVGPDLRGRGDAQVTQATCNDFLRRARGSIEHATRIGLGVPSNTPPALAWSSIAPSSSCTRHPALTRFSALK